MLVGSAIVAAVSMIAVIAAYFMFAHGALKRPVWQQPYGSKQKGSLVIKEMSLLLHSSRTVVQFIEVRQ